MEDQTVKVPISTLTDEWVTRIKIQDSTDEALYDWVTQVSGVPVACTCKDFREKAINPGFVCVHMMVTWRDKCNGKN